MNIPLWLGEDNRTMIQEAPAKPGISPQMDGSYRYEPILDHHLWCT